MSLILRRIVSEAGVAVVAVVLVVVLGGCTYHGSLKPGFYSPSQRPATMLPLRAALVVGDQCEAQEYSAERIFYGHAAQIKMHPALGQALTQAC